MKHTNLAQLAVLAASLSVGCGSDAEGGAGGGGGAAGAGGGSGAVGGGAGDGGGGVGASGGGGAGGTSGSAGSAGAGGTGGGGPNVDRSGAKLHEFELDPQVLDSSTVDSLELQYAQLDTRTPPVGKLVVFLAGANNKPLDWRNHGRLLAGFGFHVLIPHYDNRWSSQNVCSGMGSSCGVDTRWEALVGEDTSAAVDISRADSAEGRVVTMLKHLTLAHTGGDWGYYLNSDDSLRYDRIVSAGISHGASSAGLYAARRAFSRAVMHSGSPAGSASAQKLTPVSQWYAFAHTGDPAYPAIASSWESFALPGALADIDGAAPPFGGSHRLITSASSTYPHCSVVVHSSSPKDSAGDFVFEAAWRYLYGVAP